MELRSNDGYLTIIRARDLLEFRLGHQDFGSNLICLIFSHIPFFTPKKYAFAMRHPLNIIPMQLVMNILMCHRKTLPCN